MALRVWVTVVRYLLFIKLIVYTGTDWVHDDMNGIWAYEHPIDKLLGMLFAPAQLKDPTCHLCKKLVFPSCDWHFGGKLCYAPVTIYYSGTECAEVRVSCVGGAVKAHGEVLRTGRIGTFRLAPIGEGPRIWHLSEPETHYELPVVLKCSRNATWTAILWKQLLKYEQMRVDQIYCN